MTQTVHFASYYRWLVITEYLHLEVAPTSVLDVGCHDGYFLSRLVASLKVGIDLDPPPSGKQYHPVMRADLLFLPFKPGSFDTILAFDVLEHVDDDRGCLASLVNLLSPQGRLWLSVPCQGFRIFPGFLTSRAERGWGHARRGYSLQTLETMLPPGVDVRAIYWNEPFFRVIYLALRLVYPLWPGLARSLVASCVRLDGMWQEGERGHMFVEVRQSGG